MMKSSGGLCLRLVAQDNLWAAERKILSVIVEAEKKGKEGKKGDLESFAAYIVWTTGEECDDPVEERIAYTGRHENRA